MEKVLNKQMEAVRAVESGPSITETNLEHLAPMKYSSTSSAIDENKKPEETSKSEEKGAEKKSLEIEEQKKPDLKPTKPVIKSEESGKTVNTVRRNFKVHSAVIKNSL